MNKKVIITITLLLGCVVAGFAQGGTLPFLRLNADTRAAGMGDTYMGEVNSMYIYTNPTSFLMDTTKNIYSSYTLGLLPEIEDNQLMYHAASAGYRIGNQAILVGFRYMGGLEIQKVSMTGTQGKTIKPYDYAVDLTYTRNLGGNFSAYLTGTFIQSYIGKTSYTGSGSGGVYYRNAFDMSGKKVQYTLGVGFYDLGGAVKYGKKEYDQPTSIGVGGSFGLAVANEHRLNLAWTARYFVLPSDASDITGGLGLEYEMFHMANIRAGYHFEDANSYTTFGLGFKHKYFQIDAAYKLANEEGVDNSLFLGCSVKF